MMSENSTRWPRWRDYMGNVWKALPPIFMGPVGSYSWVSCLLWHYQRRMRLRKFRGCSFSSVFVSCHALSASYLLLRNWLLTGNLTTSVLHLDRIMACFSSLHVWFWGDFQEFINSNAGARVFKGTYMAIMGILHHSWDSIDALFMALVLYSCPSMFFRSW